MTCYSKDLRERAVKYLLDGHTYAEAMKVYNVGRTALWRWKNMLEKEGNLDSKPRGNYFKKINPQILIEYLEEHPDAYLHEIAAVFLCSEAAVCKALKKIGYTKKKENHIQRTRQTKSRGIYQQDKCNT